MKAKTVNENLNEENKNISNKEVEVLIEKINKKISAVLDKAGEHSLSYRLKNSIKDTIKSHFNK